MTRSRGSSDREQLPCQSEGVGADCSKVLTWNRLMSGRAELALFFRSGQTCIPYMVE